MSTGPGAAPMAAPTATPGRVNYVTCCEDTWYNEFVGMTVAFAVVLCACLGFMMCACYYKHYHLGAAAAGSDAERGEGRSASPANEAHSAARGLQRTHPDDTHTPPPTHTPRQLVNGATVSNGAPSDSPAAVARNLAARWCPGDRVEAMFQDRYYTAQVAAIGADGLMIVNWEDGTHSRDVHPVFVRPPKDTLSKVETDVI